MFDTNWLLFLGIIGILIGIAFVLVGKKKDWDWLIYVGILFVVLGLVIFVISILY